MAEPSGVMRKYSHSTPVFISQPCAAAVSMTRLSTWRGFCTSGLPSMTRSPVTQATSGFHGSWIAVSGSGITSMSGCAGERSSQVAKPAKPAPDLAIASMAVAGTILARMVPNRSTKAIRKYLTPLSFAYAPSVAISSLLRSIRCHPGRRAATTQCRAAPRRGSGHFASRNSGMTALCRSASVPTASQPTLAGYPVGAGQGHAGHGGGLHGQRHQVLGLEVVHVALAVGAGDGLAREGDHREIVGEPATGEHGIEPPGELGVLRGDAGRVAAFVPVVVAAGGGAEPGVLRLPARVVVAQRNQRRRADGDGARAQRQGLGHVGAGADAARH